MVIDFFTEANKLWRKGLKNESFENIDRFINSFKNDSEKELWVKEYLPTIKLPKNQDGKLTSEFLINIFEKILAPVLIKGVNKRDVSLMLWAYKMSTNFLFYDSTYCEEMDYATRWDDLLLDTYKIAPDNDEVAMFYLDVRIKQIKHNVFNNSMIYENWNPDYARNFSTEDCLKDLDEVEILKKINRSNENVEFLNEYENNLNKLLEKIKNK